MFKDLDTQQEYFPMVARSHKDSFYGIPPKSARPMLHSKPSIEDCSLNETGALSPTTILQDGPMEIDLDVDLDTDSVVERTPNPLSLPTPGFTPQTGFKIPIVKMETNSKNLPTSKNIKLIETWCKSPLYSCKSYLTI